MKDLALIIVSFVLGWFGQLLFYRYQKRDENQQGPHVIISRVVKSDQIMFEIRNIGTDSLNSMKVKILWKQAGAQQDRLMYMFFPPEQDERLTSSSNIEVLGPSDRYNVVGVPQWADGKVVKVNIAGIGAKSQRPYEVENDIEVGAPPKS